VVETKYEAGNIEKISPQLVTSDELSLKNTAIKYKTELL